MSINSLERVTDVAPSLYANAHSQRPIESREQIVEDLWTWWAEADLRPSPIRLFVREGLLCDKFGNDLVAQSRAAALVRQGRVEHGRVEAEVLGVERLAEILIQSKSGDGVIYISPPGLEREGFGVEGRRRLSFTYLYHVGNHGRVHFLAVPELERSLEGHINLVEDLVDREHREVIIQAKIGGVSDRTLVAYPMTASHEQESLNILAKRFGYSDLLDMWKQALEAKRLRGAVGKVINHASAEIWSATKRQDVTRLEVLGDVFRGVVALLVKSDLTDVGDICQYFDEKAEALLASRQVDSLGGVSWAKYLAISESLGEFYWRIQNNHDAQEVLSGGSCPGDRGLGFGPEIFDRTQPYVTNNVMMDVLQPQKSEESYSFDHDGQCVVCKVDPKKLGPCNICEECDHKLRAQSD